MAPRPPAPARSIARTATAVRTGAGIGRAYTRARWPNAITTRAGGVSTCRSSGVTNGPGVNTPGIRKPPWLKVRLASGPNHAELKELMRDASLHTVCEEAMCPNIGECWEQREATFLILGAKCTRRCGFCDVMTARPDPVDEDEPERIARDGPRDGTALRRAHRRRPRRPARRRRRDLGGHDPRVPRGRARHRRRGASRPTSRAANGDLATVLEAAPDVFAHNLETVRRLHDRIRPAFGYDRSLDVLRIARRLRAGQITKSNLILGMGERPDEVAEAMRDLRDAGVRHPHDRPVPAADDAAPPGRSMGASRRVRRARSWARRSSASRTSRPGRSFAPATTRASSSGGRATRAASRWPEPPTQSGSESRAARTGNIATAMLGWSRTSWANTVRSRATHRTSERARTRAVLG